MIAERKRCFWSGFNFRESSMRRKKANKTADSAFNMVVQHFSFYVVSDSVEGTSRESSNRLNRGV